MLHFFKNGTKNGGITKTTITSFLVLWMPTYTFLDYKFEFPHNFPATSDNRALIHLVKRCEDFHHPFLTHQDNKAIHSSNFFCLRL